MLVCVPLIVVILLALVLVTMAALEPGSPQKFSEAQGLFGIVRGTRMAVSDQGREYTVLAFMGIPFAKAPSGSLRFKKSKPLDKQLKGGVLRQALDCRFKRPPCPQRDFYLGRQNVKTDNASEDCLHLNIWTPSFNCPDDSTDSPERCGTHTVLFFLYGAAFQNGGNSFELYDGRYLSALGDLVVVVPNYRVGALGFLSGGPSGSEPLPGNAGLHDQRLAFAWTLAYIPHFGGNASRIVLAGHDAGASSIGYHLLSGDADFWTRHVTRFILQSGGPYHRYGSNNLTEETELANRFRCPTDLSSEEALECLQRVRGDRVARALADASFVPVFRRPPLTGSQPSEAALRRSSKPAGPSGKQFLVGRVEREGVYPWFVERRRQGSASSPEEVVSRLLHHHDAAWLEHWQTATGITLNPSSEDVRSYQEAVGDFNEVCPMMEFIERLKGWQNLVYAYQLAYQPSYSSWKSETDEAVHFEDMELVFGMPLRPDVPANEEDREWARTMINIWATFAHTGKTPTVQKMLWPQYDLTTPITMKLGPHKVNITNAEKRQRCDYLRGMLESP